MSERILQRIVSGFLDKNTKFKELFNMNYVLENDQIVLRENVKTDFLDRAYVFGSR